MRKIIALMLAMILVASVLTGCNNDKNNNTSSSLPPASASPGGLGESSPEIDTGVDTLVIAMTKDENTLTPYTYLTGTPGLDVMRLVYDTLFSFDAQNNIVPWMIEDDYTVDADSRIYTMTLKEGLFWHDGEALTAEDVKFTFEYALTQTRTRWKGIAGQIESLVITDGNKLTLTLANGNPNFLRAGLCDMPIMPKHIYEAVENAGEYAGETVGSSLYRLAEYKTGEYYKFEAVDGYFKGTAWVATINMPIMTDSAAVSQALISKQLAASTRGITPETFDVFQAADGIEILSGRGYAPSMLQFNCERELLSNPQFRRALTYALDIQSMLDTVMLGYADPGLPGFYTEDMAGALPELSYEHNPDTANAMLDSLGYTQKDAGGIRLSNGSPITFELLVYSDSTSRIRSAELIKESFAAVGIGLTVTAMEADTVDEYVWPEFDVAAGRDYDMAMWGWSAPVQLNPASLVRLGMSDLDQGDLNIGGLRSGEYDVLCETYLGTTNAGERTRISGDMQRLLTELAPFVNLWYDNMNYAVNADAYDGWVVQKGAGIINRYSFLP